MVLLAHHLAAIMILLERPHRGMVLEDVRVEMREVL